ncbi:hypothetical protein POTOM_060729 [Populus tomentosa]|uniref:non-specific serine/threonine protein kinase n=1 Tax=Populus tomentosa TaxID=118781 RepID=A0A8X8C0T4_POPTO|nr:hypothetical protein POTOM_060729 [Populus tomentosa]
MISLAVHRNLLRLHGFCMTTTERLLVYPYMSNGSVCYSSQGQTSPGLGYEEENRLRSARGLLYLHETMRSQDNSQGCEGCNILLDDYCEAVVGDFGLAKLLDHRDSHVTTAVRGTVGHIPLSIYQQASPLRKQMFLDLEYFC